MEVPWVKPEGLSPEALGHLITNFLTCHGISL